MTDRFSQSSDDNSCRHQSQNHVSDGRHNEFENQFTVNMGKVEPHASAYLATAGVVVPDKSVPGWLMRAMGATLETSWRVLPTKTAPPLNRVEAYMVSHPQVFDDSAARRELGYQPIITVDEGMVDLTTRTRMAGRSHW